MKKVAKSPEVKLRGERETPFRNWGAGGVALVPPVPACVPPPDAGGVGLLDGGVLVAPPCAPPLGCVQPKRRIATRKIANMDFIRLGLDVKI